jgi:hypothetical protein
MLNRESEEGVTAVNVQLSTDIRAMMFYSADTYMQLASYLDARLCAGDQLKYASLSPA